MGSLDGSYFQLLMLLSYTTHSSLLILRLFISCYVCNVCDIGLFDLENGNYALPQSTLDDSTSNQQTISESSKWYVALFLIFPNQTFQWHKNIFLHEFLNYMAQNILEKNKK